MKQSKQLTPEQIEALKEIDTPTICNAIERFEVRGRVEGFMGMDIRCMLPELGRMVGYAVTLTADTTTPGLAADNRVWLRWLNAMGDSPAPCVVVIKDVGPQPRKSAHFGEVMSTIALRLGAVGVLSDGGLRDIDAARELGFHYFGSGLVPSHGNNRLLDVNIAVEIDGVLVNPGDLVHADANGVTIIPHEVAGKVTEVARGILADEAELLEYVNGPDFTVDGLFERKFTH